MEKAVSLANVVRVSMVSGWQRGLVAKVVKVMRVAKVAKVAR